MLLALALAHANVGTAFKGGFNIGVQGGFGHTKIAVKVNPDDAAKVLPEGFRDLNLDKATLSELAKRLDAGSDKKETIKEIVKELGADPGDLAKIDSMSSEELTAQLSTARTGLEFATKGKLEIKANHGFAGVQLGYLKRFEKFGLGALVEGNYGFGSRLKLNIPIIDQNSAEFGSASLGLNLAAYLRGVFFATDRLFFGGDFGLFAQVLKAKQKNTKNSVDQQKEVEKIADLFYGPSVRAVFGIALTDHIVATATAGLVFNGKSAGKTMAEKERADKGQKQDPFKIEATSYQGSLGLSFYL